MQPLNRETSLAAVSLGSNMGDRLAHLNHGAQALAALPQTSLVKRSEICETAAVDCLEPFDFLNAVVLLETRLSAKDLLHALLEIERERGRERPYVNAPRPLDLDLLLYGEHCIDEPDLQVPHPRMHQRLFVLAPLARILPDFVHPGVGKTIAELAEDQERLGNAEDAVVFRGHVWSDEHQG